MNKQKHVVIIGSGFGGLGSACILSKAGYKVTLVEKNSRLGGRANLLEKDGYRFDMGPSWYLMPDVFEQFFDLIDEDIEAHLDLKKLSPSYRIFFKENGREVDIYSDLKKDIPTLEAIEPGAGEHIRDYLERAKMQYEIATEKFMYRNYSSVLDFLTPDVLTKGLKLSVFSNMHRYVQRFFKTPELQKIMQYTLVFLGSSPYNTPALYSIMSHIDFDMGVYYPQGGMYTVIEALASIAQKNGADLRVSAPVSKIRVEDGQATGVILESGETINADIVISNADYHHTETALLEKNYRQYSENYWESRVLAPSAFILYLGVDGEIDTLTHHNLIFSEDWEENFAQIFDDPQWPSDPSLYICNPSKTDPSVAPEGKENLFVLVPIPPGLSYSDEQIERYSDKIIDMIADQCNISDLRNRIEVMETFCSNDFESYYNSFKGSALGLAHTMTQTAFYRPDNRSKKVKDLYYVGAGTNPGIGMPVCLISAELAYKRIIGDKSHGPLTSL